MEPLAILALQLAHAEAHSALPDAPVVDGRPSRLGRLVQSLAVLSARARVTAAGPRRTDVRRAD